jgi:hypothetical protein
MKNGFMIKNSFDIIIMRHNLMRNEDFETLEQCLDVADGYAIEFGKWILRNFNNYGLQNEKELLEKFKQLKNNEK